MLIVYWTLPEVCTNTASSSRVLPANNHSQYFSYAPQMCIEQVNQCVQKSMLKVAVWYARESTLAQNKKRTTSLYWFTINPSLLSLWVYHYIGNTQSLPIGLWEYVFNPVSVAFHIFPHHTFQSCGIDKLHTTFTSSDYFLRVTLLPRLFFMICLWKNHWETFLKCEINLTFKFASCFASFAVTKYQMRLYPHWTNNHSLL